MAADRFYQKIMLHGLTKALFQFFGLTANQAIGFDQNGQLKNVEDLGVTVTEGELALADVTTADASSTKHGFLKKLSNTATEVLDGQGAWRSIAAILGFTPESVSNKSTDVEADGASDTKYPSVKAVKDYVDANAGGSDDVLEFVGLINQSGTSAPTIAATMKNTIGAITRQYLDVGTYRLNCVGAFPENRTLLTPSFGEGASVPLGGDEFTFYRESDDSLLIGTGANNLLINFPITIRVYPAP